MGCAISKASASMMTEAIKGMPVEEAVRIFDEFRHMITRKPGEDFDDELLGDIETRNGSLSCPKVHHHLAEPYLRGWYSQSVTSLRAALAADQPVLT